MAWWWPLLFGLWTVTPAWTGDERLTVCMNTSHHKQVPGPEDTLYEECVPWKDSACCTADTSWEAHLEVSKLHNFSLTHCGLLTPSCQKHIIQAICFYACSPNLGPWIRQVAPRGQGERAVDVPLCSEDCEEWWADCRTSFTCKSNWLGGWDQSRGKSRCPAGAQCHPFPYYFPTPADLCKRIWGDSFQASTARRGSGRCFQKWFEPAQGNPNRAVVHLLPSPAPCWEIPHLLLVFSLFLPIPS